MEIIIVIMILKIMMLLLQYSGLFERGKIFANFTNPALFVKILPL